MSEEKITRTAARDQRRRGNIVRKGDPVECDSQEEADDLERQGAVEPTPDEDDDESAAGGQGGRPKASSLATQSDAIHAAITSLLKSDPDKANEMHWTKSGLPRVKAIEGITKSDVDAADVELVWNGMQPILGDGSADSDGNADSDGMTGQ